ncbi:MAG: large conductance mechanosensitive channel protein MscL [Actinomycetota bacterium]
MSNFVKEFRDFVNRGNVVDLAVAVVLGAAFTPIIDAIVTGLITPIVAAIFGQPDFSGLAIDIGDAQILYGLIIEAILSFIFVAFALFVFVVKPWNRIQEGMASEDEDDAGPSEADLLAEIRDIMKSNN